MSLTVAIVTAFVATAVIMLVVRGKKTPAVVTAGVFGLVVVSVIIGASAYSHGQSSDRENDRRESAQASAAAAQRAYDAQMAQYGACLSKVATRADVRTVLKAMVDLSDLFPDSAAARAYTASRQALIDAKYPPVDALTACGDQPHPPATGDTP